MEFAVKVSQTYSRDSFPIQERFVPYVDQILIPYGMITDRIEQIANEIIKVYHGEPVTLLCVMKAQGAFRFCNELYLRLIKRISVKMEFIRLKSYVNTQSTGNVQIESANLGSIQNENVVIVEDIIDTGRSMAKLIPFIQGLRPKSLKIATLVWKELDNEQSNDRSGISPNFVGFIIPDFFIIGFGFDYNETFRDLNAICVINEKGKQDFQTAN